MQEPEPYAEVAPLPPLGGEGRKIMGRTPRELFRDGLVAACFAYLAIFACITLYRITWDTPSNMGWDGCLYTDEGFYSGDAITYILEGKWLVEKEYNQSINLPLGQWVYGYAFKIFGFGLLTLRLVNWVFMWLWLGSAFLLFNRFLGWRWALGGVTLITLNHVTYGMSRFALAEMPMSFFGTLAFVFAVYSKGPRAYWMAAASALSFSLAVLTKNNVAFMAPVLAVVMILVELDWKKILVKFVLCSAIFGAIIGAWAWFLVLPHLEEFKYFFSLNAGVTGSADPERLASALDSVRDGLNFGDKLLVEGLPFLLGAFFLLAGKQRFHPLFWICAGLYGMFLLFYTYYGRIYPRFFTVSYPALYGLVIVALSSFWRMGGWRRFPFWVLFLLALYSAQSNARKTCRLVVEAENTYNEMAADIKKMMEGDPRQNNVVMGHNSAGLALRTGCIPRNDRYGIVPLEERLRLFKPGWYICEVEMRSAPHEIYFSQNEWIYRYFDVELKGRYTLYRNYRGYQMAFYRLVPREEEMDAFARRPRSTRSAHVPE